MSDQEKKEKAPPQSTSFQDLMGDEEAAPVAPPPPRPVAKEPAKEPSPTQDDAPPGGTAYGDLEAIELARAREEDSAEESVEDRINARVLSGSAPKASPIWWQCALLTAAAVGLMLAAANAPEFAGLAGLMAYAVMFAGAAAAFWSAYGIYRDQGTSRWICIVLAVVSVLVIGRGFLMTR